MHATRPRWTAVLLIGVWLATAGPVRAADKTTTSPSEPPAQETATVEAQPAAPPQAGSPTATQARPAAKPPPPQVKPQPRKRFRPSEEIHVDKAVDFPADI